MRPICCIDRNIPLLAEILAPVCDVRQYDGRAITRRDILDCFALFIRSTTRVNKTLLEGTQARFVASATAGTDHIDDSYLRNKGITFVSAPGANSNSVAEYAICALVYWSEQFGIVLSGKRLGIVGYGNIGRKVARYASELLKMQILINDPPLKNIGFKFPAEFQYAELDEICAASDVITNHVPLTNEGHFQTVNLFDERRVGLIKEGALFIHASRGGVVSELPIIDRLRNKSLTAVFDVFSGEPHINKDLARLSLLATPHIAGYSYDAKIRGAYKIAEEFYRYMQVPFQNVSEANSIIKEEFSQNLLATLMARRSLEKDSAALKSMIHLPDAELAAAFDLYRKQYPVRRETLESVFELKQSRA